MASRVLPTSGIEMYTRTYTSSGPTTYQTWYSRSHADNFYTSGYFNISVADSANAVWEGLAFFIPSLPLKDSGHISAIFDGMNLTLPIKLVATP